MNATADTTRAEWLTVSEAAVRAKVSEQTIYRAIKQGRLRASKLGSRMGIRILETWLDAWLVSLSTPTLINPEAPANVGDPQPLPFRGRKPK